MCRLTTEDLEVAEDGEVWIKTARKKTKIDYEVPLLYIPVLILDKYRDIAPEGKLLPMYSNNELNRTRNTVPAQRCRPRPACAGWVMPVLLYHECFQYIDKVETIP